MGSMTQWLNLLAYSLPELFGLGIAIALLATSARPGPARRLGLIGVGAMSIAAIIGLGMNIYQTVMLASMAGDHESMQRMFVFLGAIRIALNLVSMGGLLAVVWALCGATRVVANADQTH